MLKPTFPRVTLALVGGLVLILIAAWSSGSHGEICKEGQSGHEQCSNYNLAPFIFIEIFKALDAASVAITALATVAIGIFTWTIWRVNQSQLRHARMTERAYIFARVVLKTEELKGAVYGTPTVIPVPYIEVVVDNHGKTPAYVSELALSCCLVEELPKLADLQSDYKNSTLLANLSIGPTAVEIRTYRRRELREAAGKVMYGRVYYTDIFGDPHSTGFIYRIHHNGIAAPLESAPEYTAWD